ncbi:hypothetical protein Tco_0702174 [Tanacetum coccineum]|uniref:Uncharacterized protein n=1 Tax=Tanacetum coccineum TaxID=301880 RepID=A0ABQ4XX68_9ASTR
MTATSSPLPSSSSSEPSPPRTTTTETPPKYCPGVLGGDTGNGSTYSLNKGPGVLGGDTCDGYIYNNQNVNLS